MSSTYQNMKYYPQGLEENEMVGLNAQRYEKETPCRRVLMPGR